MTVTKTRKQTSSAKRQEAAHPLPVSIHPVRNAEWLPVDEFYSQIVGLSNQNVDIIVDLSGVNYLDAISLQMLLALKAAQKSASRGLSIKHASSGLLSWFEYAGAVQEFIFA